MGEGDAWKLHAHEARRVRNARKNNAIVWAESVCAPRKRDSDQRQQDFDWISRLVVHNTSATISLRVSNDPIIQKSGFDRSRLRTDPLSTRHLIKRTNNELTKYLSDLTEYYTVLGRPRFDRLC